MGSYGRVTEIALLYVYLSILSGCHVMHLKQAGDRIILVMEEVMSIHHGSGSY